MTTLSIRLDADDLQALRKRAQELRIPPTIYARTLIVQGMRCREVNEMEGKR
jgi:hypothetical protein